MAFTNFDTKEINCKIVYMGAKGSGKTANLRSVLGLLSQEIKQGLFEIEDIGITPYFEFLPISLGMVKDYHIKMHLYTLPPFTLYDSVPSTILKGIDGWVYVCDSSVSALQDNIQGLQKAKRLLQDEGHNLGDLPCVIQYNKSDVSPRVPTVILRRELNTFNVPDVEAVAHQSIGTLETIHAMADLILEQLAPRALDVQRERGGYEFGG